MKGVFLVFLAVGFVCLSAVSAHAQGAFRDLPADHWTLEALHLLYEKGLLEGFPDSHTAHPQTITRYEVAMVAARTWLLVKDGEIRGETVDPAAVFIMQCLATECRAELADLGIDPDEIISGMEIEYSPWSKVSVSEDIPQDHWTIEAFNLLVKLRLYDAFPNGFGNQTITRYELALVTFRAIKVAKDKIAQGDEIDPVGKLVLQHLANEFKPEIRGFLYSQFTSDIPWLR